MSLSALLIIGLALVSPANPGAGSRDPQPETRKEAGIEAGADAMICVIAPRVEAGATDPRGRGIVMERPSLVVTDRLREVIIERRGRPTLRLRSPGGVLPVVIPWQGDALTAGEVATVRLRPEHSPAEQEATLQLVAATAAVLRGYRQETAALGRRPTTWLRAIESHLDQGDSERAWALLFDPDAPKAELLEQLRREVTRQGCGDPRPSDRHR
ncbi:MAG: hypothetical protein ACKOCM_07000 [Cyanobacteriota bacterium]